MQGSEFDEEAFFGAIERSGVRALLIGRRALIALGAPVLTADYDLWIHIDDIEKLNTLAEPFELFPSRSPEEARRRGRYVLENDEKVDVLVARSVPTIDGETVPFELLWGRKQTVALTGNVTLSLPTISDLIRTKKFGSRPRDLADIEYLNGLLHESTREPQ